jgi:hypothetical protein
MEQSQKDRINLSCTNSLEDIRSRLRGLSGQDQYSLQMEFLEWMVMDFDDQEIDFTYHHLQWEDE